MVCSELVSPGFTNSDRSIFQLPAFQISFQLKSISVKQLFAFAKEKDIIYVITGKKIH